MISVFIEYEPNESGKGKFISRLVPELERLGVRVSYKPDGCDVALCLTRFRSKFKGPRVLRVDGIHLVSSKKTAWNNSRVRRCINKADAVIWQSSFCKMVSKDVLGVRPKKEYVIHNGAPPEEFKVKLPSVNLGKNIFICGNFASRRHKRLEEMLLVAINMNDYNIKWHVAGNIDWKPQENEHINYLGRINQKTVAYYLASCDLMLDLQTAAWCPNSIVEALVSGTPVIGCGGAGAEELIKDSGRLIYDEPPMDMMRKEKYYSLDLDCVEREIRDELESPTKVERPDLYISNIAKKYLEVFEGVL